MSIRIRFQQGEKKDLQTVGVMSSTGSDDIMQVKVTKKFNLFDPANIFWNKISLQFWNPTTFVELTGTPMPIFNQ